MGREGVGADVGSTPPPKVPAKSLLSDDEMHPEDAVPIRQAPLKAGSVARGVQRSEGSVRSRLLRGLSWRALNSVTGVVGAFVTSAAAARLVRGGDFAAVLLVLTTFVVGPVVVRVGLGNNAVRSVAHLVARGEELDAVALLQAIIRTAIVLGAVLSLPVAALILATARPDLIADVPLLGLALLFESVRVTASDVFTGLQLTAWSVVYSFQVRSLISGVVLLAMLFGGVQTSFTTLLLVLVAINAVLCGLAMFSLRRVLAAAHSRSAPLALVRTLIRGSFPFFVAEIGLFVIGRGDIWVAARILGPTTGPIYGAASTLASQLIIPLTMANLVFAPMASALAQQQRWSHVSGLARLIATTALVATAAGVAAIVIAGRQLLDLVYGPGFGAGQLFLVTLGVGSVATVATGPCGFVLLMSGKQSIVMRVVLCWAGAASVLLPLGAWAYGGFGLAIASSAATVGVNIHLAIESWRSLGIATLPFIQPRKAREAWNDLKSDLHPHLAT